MARGTRESTLPHAPRLTRPSHTQALQSQAPLVAWRRSVPRRTGLCAAKSIGKWEPLSIHPRCTQEGDLHGKAHTTIDAHESPARFVPPHEFARIDWISRAHGRSRAFALRDHVFLSASRARSTAGRANQMISLVASACLPALARVAHFRCRYRINGTHSRAP